MGGGDSLGILINYEIFGIPRDPQPKKFTDERHLSLKGHHNSPLKYAAVNNTEAILIHHDAVQQESKTSIQQV